MNNNSEVGHLVAAVEMLFIENPQPKFFRQKAVFHLNRAVREILEIQKWNQQTSLSTTADELTPEEIQRIRSLGDGDSAKAILIAAAISAATFPAGVVDIHLFTANLVDALDAAQSTQSST